MIKPCNFLILATGIFFMSLSAYADDNAVETWTRNMIKTTFSVSYDNYESVFEKVKPHYTFDAWNSLRDFLGQHMQTVKNDQLSLQPVLQGPATITEKGTVKNNHFFDGIQYWKVHQTLEVPQLNLTVDFTILVIKKIGSSYLISSLDMSTDE